MRHVGGDVSENTPDQDPPSGVTAQNQEEKGKLPFISTSDSSIINHIQLLILRLIFFKHGFK